jgi:hypothetical protein
MSHKRPPDRRRTHAFARRSGDGLHSFAVCGANTKRGSPLKVAKPGEQPSCSICQRIQSRGSR